MTSLWPTLTNQGCSAPHWQRLSEGKSWRRAGYLRLRRMTASPPKASSVSVAGSGIARMVALVSFCEMVTVHGVPFNRAERMLAGLAI